MDKEKKGRPLCLVALAVCWLIAILAFSGAVLRSDIVGRIIFGVAWTFLGLVWLGAYLGYVRFGKGG